MSTKANEELIARANRVLRHVRFQNYAWVLREGHGGVYLSAMFEAPDNEAKGDPVPVAQYTRKWLLSPAMTNSEIVQTAFKLVLTSVEHETREQFTYRSARIFGPHFNVDDLAEMALKGGSERGSRKAT